MPSPARSCSSSRSSSTRTVYRRSARPIYFGTLGVMVLVLAAGAATRGSRRWIDVGFFTLPAVRVRQGALRARARRASSPSARGRFDELRDAARARSRSALGPILLVFVQPDIGTALVYTAALAAVLFVSGVRWLHLGVLAGARDVGRALACSGCCRRPGVNVLKPYQAAAPHRLHASRQRPARRDVQPDAVDHRGRRGRAARPRRSGRDADAARLPARACDRLRVRLARRAARLLRRLDPAAALPARRLARAQDRRRARATSTARSSRAGSRSCSCSRCS